MCDCMQDPPELDTGEVDEPTGRETDDVDPTEA